MSPALTGGFLTTTPHPTLRFVVVFIFFYFFYLFIFIFIFFFFNSLYYF